MSSASEAYLDGWQDAATGRPTRAPQLRVVLRERYRRGFEDGLEARGRAIRAAMVDPSLLEERDAYADASGC